MILSLVYLSTDTNLEYLYDAQIWNTTSESTVGLHLHQLDLSGQTPCYRAVEQDQAKVERFLEVKFPKIQRLAEKIGADIAFEDEAGVGIRTRSGRTWGEVGHPPEVAVSDQRGGYNVLSIITATGATET